MWLGLQVHVNYKVFVDDNFHYMDVEERYALGEFESVDIAIIKCKQIVDRFLADSYKPNMTADQLYRHYTSFGEDPFIVGPERQGNPKPLFSAWDYARERCDQICKGSSDKT
jgi:hypothetical protein